MKTIPPGIKLFTTRLTQDEDHVVIESGYHVVYFGSHIVHVCRGVEIIRMVLNPPIRLYAWYLRWGWLPWWGLKVNLVSAGEIAVEPKP